MSITMVIELILFVSVGIGWVVVLSTTRRRKSIERRIATSVVVGLPVKPRTGVRFRLVQQGAGSGFNRIARLLRIPLDLPLAHVMRPVWVMVIGTAVAWAAGSLSHFVIRMA